MTHRRRHVALHLPRHSPEQPRAVGRAVDARPTLTLGLSVSEERQRESRGLTHDQRVIGDAVHLPFTLLDRSLARQQRRVLWPVLARALPRSRTRPSSAAH